MCARTGENVDNAVKMGFGIGYERIRDPPVKGHPQSQNGNPLSSDGITGIANPVYELSSEQPQLETDNPQDYNYTD